MLLTINLISLVWRKKQWDYIAKYVFSFVKMGSVPKEFFSSTHDKNDLKALTDVVFLHNARVTVYGRISKNDNHNHISAVQLHNVCWMTFHSILLAMYKYSRSSDTPCLTVDVENPQLISNIAIICFNFASVHVDVFL